MLGRIAHDLRRRIETHGLGIEERRAEGIRMVAFDPAGCIGDEREAGGVTFRKTVGTEAFQLGERALREFGRVAVLHHAGDQLVLELADTAGELEGRHRL